MPDRRITDMAEALQLLEIAYRRLEAVHESGKQAQDSLKAVVEDSAIDLAAARLALDQARERLVADLEARAARLREDG